MFAPKTEVRINVPKNSQHKFPRFARAFHGVKAKFVQQAQVPTKNMSDGREYSLVELDPKTTMYVDHAWLSPA